MRILWLALLFVPWMADADDLTELTWVVAPYPPFHIAEGPLAGKGMVDVVVPHMQAAVSGFHHVIGVMTDSRSWQEIREGRNVCQPAVLKTPERERVAVFSEAGAIVPSMVLIMRAEQKQRLFGKRKTIALREVLENPTLRIGMITERAYGEVDSMLRAQHNSERLIQVSNNYGPLSLLRMLNSGRIDAVVEYPWIVRYVAMGLSDMQSLSTMGIDELQPFFRSYVACPNTDVGREVIRQLNVWIRTQLPLDANRRIVGDWLDPDTLERYQAAYEQMIAPVTR
ncbi:TIGR02285 family protein [Thalassolituus sp. LLYu03]|uniref:TIGR02285 family protein n=1 Tax=Thalassolituus sp. LLYu03 TaxID=3421656 RepID=UPI003D2881D7